MRYLVIWNIGTDVSDEIAASFFMIEEILIT
jgi:hypothetical protein